MLNIDSRSLLGIMTSELTGEPPFANSDTYRNLCELGSQLGMEVFVFSPGRIHWGSQSVAGYAYRGTDNSWIKRQYPLPSFIYDRCFHATREAFLTYRSQTRKLRSIPHVRFLGHGLAGKWEVLQLLKQHTDFHPYLPDTLQLQNVQDVLNWLTQRPEAFLKPQGGSQGRGTLYMTLLQGDVPTYQAMGRNGHNSPFNLRFSDEYSLRIWLKQFIGKRPYLIQEYLSLHTASGSAFDIRSLVQKNEKGYWQTTGMGIRCGQNGSITSNLHGGGTASKLMPFLIQEFGNTKAVELKQTLIDLSQQIPPFLESMHGRLVELGIDFGIDRCGHIWILEINSKPGRTIFAHLKDEKTHRISIENPIRYAGFLLGHRECTGRDRRAKSLPGSNRYGNPARATNLGG
jgi:hypothetical protein